MAIITISGHVELPAGVSSCRVDVYHIDDPDGPRYFFGDSTQDGDFSFNVDTGALPSYIPIYLVFDLGEGYQQVVHGPYNQDGTIPGAGP